MGKAKKRKKAILQNRRLRKVRAGKNVPFNLSNCPYKLKGISNRYEYKINVHNCNFNEAKFSNVRYRSGHITQSTFKNAHLNCIDFISVNLKRSKFKSVEFRNCIFINCNLTDVDFENAKFQNTYFICCKFQNTKKIPVSSEIKILSHYPDIEISSNLADLIILMGNNEKLEKFHILTTENKRVNQWLIYLLLNKYSEQELMRFFQKLLDSNKTQFYTLNNYFYYIQKYYKK